MIFKSQLPDAKPETHLKGLVSNFFWQQLDTFARRTLIVDLVSRRHWTGASIKEVSSRIAYNLISHAQLEANSDCVTFCYNNDHLLLGALGLLFAGASVCAGAPEDPENEHAHMLNLMRPALVFIEHRHLREMLKIRKDSGGYLTYKLILINDNLLSDNQFKSLEAEEAALWVQEGGGPTRRGLLGFHRHLCAPPILLDPKPELPVQVDPERPAFVLLTSGSTGAPKPVGRSQRNSLYVCHSLDGAEKLWHLDESSVLAGHLQLDHGTGTFGFKMTLAKGLKLIVMHGYEFKTMLEAIRTFAISDVCLGSALLHNFVSAIQDDVKLDTSTLGSLRNLIAVGSPIASQSLVRSFMDRFPACSIRQAFGMTECGFVSVVERQLNTEDTRLVGSLLPNLEVKLIERNNNDEVNSEEGQNEINELDREGELYVRGPTVSSGYLGEQFNQQSKAVFLKDGFYKTNDICFINTSGQLSIRGRFNDVLCLHDGWKVLPAEIEQVLLKHPLLAEAVVVGIPHPELPTCHAPRAYVVPRPGVKADFDDEPGSDCGDDLEAYNGSVETDNNGNEAEGCRLLTHKSVFEFTAERLSEPKHLVGGIRIMRKLPRISIGKYDKKLLRKLDGY